MIAWSLCSLCRCSLTTSSARAEAATAAPTKTATAITNLSPPFKIWTERSITCTKIENHTSSDMQLRHNRLTWKPDLQVNNRFKNHWELARCMIFKMEIIATVTAQRLRAIFLKARELYRGRPHGYLQSVWLTRWLARSRVNSLACTTKGNRSKYANRTRHKVILFPCRSFQAGIANYRWPTMTLLKMHKIIEVCPRWTPIKNSAPPTLLRLNKYSSHIHYWVNLSELSYRNAIQIHNIDSKTKKKNTSSPQSNRRKNPICWTSTLSRTDASKTN